MLSLFQQAFFYPPTLHFVLFFRVRRVNLV